MVHAQMPPTPQYAWPLLAARTGCTVWVKHENHTPTGAFKARGAIPYIDWLRRTHPEVTGIITATRGNHGQAQARAARAAGLSVTIVVPHGNALEKNAAMRAFGATLIEHGHDFDSAKAEALRLAGVMHLGYRDSGMPGSPNNSAPGALAGSVARRSSADSAYMRGVSFVVLETRAGPVRPCRIRRASESRRV